ncbi:MAG: hypothetical protein E7Z80_05085 [Methanobrevibacter thaueri]|nr:hypothetical protein [Methanobrevibacter thaueri]
MTTIRNIEKKCSVCTKTSEQPLIGSTSTLYYPDLDLRPSEMYRNSMFAWLDECPHCGYVAKNIENELKTPEILKSKNYQTCEDNDFKSKLAKRFYKHYLISKAEKNHELEFNSLLHCAWSCDDNNDKELSQKIRKMALKIIDKLIKENKDKNELLLIKADLLRRTLQFDKVINEFKDIKLEKSIENKIIAFQIELSEKKDSECHTLKEIEEIKY